MFLKPTAAGARLDRCPESAVKSSGSWCRVSARTDCDGTTVNLHAGGGTVPEFLPFYFLFFLFGFYWLQVSARSRPEVSGFRLWESGSFRFPTEICNPNTWVQYSKSSTIIRHQSRKFLMTEVPMQDCHRRLQICLQRIADVESINKDLESRLETHAHEFITLESEAADS